MLRVLPAAAGRSGVKHHLALPIKAAVDIKEATLCKT
jgi:hypothetical protein